MWPLMAFVVAGRNCQRRSFNTSTAGWELDVPLSIWMLLSETFLRLPR
jgi:hypothetical protein